SFHRFELSARPHMHVRGQIPAQCLYHGAHVCPRFQLYESYMYIVSWTTARELRKGRIAHNDTPVGNKTEAKRVVTNDGDTMPVDFGDEANMPRAKFGPCEPIDEHGIGFLQDFQACSHLWESKDAPTRVTADDEQLAR